MENRHPKKTATAELYQGGRLPLLYPEELSPEQAELYQHFQQHLLSWSEKTGFTLALPDGRLLGPLNAFLYSPLMSRAYHQWVDAERNHTAIPLKIRTLVILTVGSYWDSAYEIYAHSISALSLGWDESTINTIIAGRQPVHLTPDEAIAYQFTHSLISRHKVDDQLYAAAVTSFTEKGVVDLVELIGIFLTVSAILNTFQVTVPK